MIDKIESEIKDLKNIQRELNKEEYPEAFSKIGYSINRLQYAINSIIEKQKPDECSSPICQNKSVKYPSNRPRYCRKCYEMKAN